MTLQQKAFQYANTDDGFAEYSSIIASEAGWRGLPIAQVEITQTTVNKLASRTDELTAQEIRGNESAARLRTILERCIRQALDELFDDPSFRAATRSGTN